jgi:hypothetical protein
MSHEKKAPDTIRFLTLSLAALALLLTTGCDRDDLLKRSGYDRVSLMESKTPPRQEALARQCAELLRRGRYDEVIHTLRPDLVGAETHQSFIAIHDILAVGEPVSIKVIDAQQYPDGDAQITNIVLDYEFPPFSKATIRGTVLLPARWVFATFTIRSTNAAPDLIDRINVAPSELPIETINAFTLENKGASQYAAFATGILLWAFTIYAAVVCIRSRIGPRKWLWILSMLFTLTLASVNWTSGHWSFNHISFKIGLPPMPANLFCDSAYGPWTLTLGLPIGGIAFVLYRRFKLGKWC